MLAALSQNGTVWNNPLLNTIPMKSIYNSGWYNVTPEVRRSFSESLGTCCSVASKALSYHYTMLSPTTYSILLLLIFLHSFLSSSFSYTLCCCYSYNNCSDETHCCCYINIWRRRRNELCVLLLLFCGARSSSGCKRTKTGMAFVRPAHQGGTFRTWRGQLSFSMSS